MAQDNKYGILYVVATPIGNLQDFSPRAIATLQSVDLILAEDTRHFSRLKHYANIQTPVKSYHEHNERHTFQHAITLLKEGKAIALVSDAGTPTINDPGYRIVDACLTEQILVKSIPGPCAITAALSISGMGGMGFFFGGFLPHKSGQRGRCLDEALGRPVVSVFFESPHRILKTLQQLSEKDPTRHIAVCRELTKIHEEVLRGPVEEILATFLGRPSIKGEFVILIRPAESERIVSD